MLWAADLQHPSGGIQAGRHRSHAMDALKILDKVHGVLPQVACRLALSDCLVVGKVICDVKQATAGAQSSMVTTQHCAVLPAVELGTRMTARGGYLHRWCGHQT